MTFSQIECFLEAARCGSITKAGTNLFMSQQSVSRQIKLLEEELGLKLFKRLRHGIELTENGRIFYETEERLMREHNTLVDQLKDSHTEGSSHLRIGFGGFGSFVQQDIVQRIFRFSDFYSNLDVEYYDEPVNLLINNLNDGKLDIILTYMSELEKSRDIMVRPIPYGTGQIGMVLARSSPYALRRNLSPSDLEDVTWGVLSQNVSGDYRTRLTNYLHNREHMQHLKLRDYTSKNNLQLALVNEKCVTISYEDIMEGFEDRLKFYPLKENDTPTDVCLAWKEERFSVKVKNLADFFDDSKQGAAAGEKDAG